MHWPAEQNGWQRRTPYTGSKRGLEEVEAAMARGSGWPGGGRGPAPRVSSPAKTFGIRSSEAEIAAWTARAELEGKKPTVWARDLLNADAAKPKR